MTIVTGTVASTGLERRPARELLEEQRRARSPMPTARRTRRTSRCSSPRSCGSRTAATAASAALPVPRRARTRRGRRRRRRSTAATAGLLQPSRGCSMKPKTTPPSPAAQSAAPDVVDADAFPPGRSGAGPRGTMNTSVSSATGMLIRKIARQTRAPISHPPSSGPVTSRSRSTPSRSRSPRLARRRRTSR